MRRVITYGTFDLLHYGHINLLQRAKVLGAYLIVALSTDEFNWRCKNERCFFPYERRRGRAGGVRWGGMGVRGGGVGSEGGGGGGAGGVWAGWSRTKAQSVGDRVVVSEHDKRHAE